MIGRKNTIRILVVFITVILVGVIATQTVEAQNLVNDREEQMEVKFTPHDKYGADRRTQNIGNYKEDVTTNKDVWEQERGMPKGVYRGPVLEPSHYEMDHSPYWRNEYKKDDNFKSTGEYGSVNLQQEVEISSDKIMNGASEFQLQVPVHADSLHTHKIESQEFVQDGPDPDGVIGDEFLPFFWDWIDVRGQYWFGKLYDNDGSTLYMTDSYDSDGDEGEALDETINEYVKPNYGEPDEDPIWGIYHDDSGELLRGSEITDYSSVEAYSNFFSSVHVYEGKINNLKTSMDKTRITSRSNATVDGELVQPEAVVPIRPEDTYGNRPYVKMNMFFESDTTYTFVYNLLTGGEKPQIYTTSSENFGKLDIQYNREKVNDIHYTNQKRLTGDKQRLFTKEMASLPFDVSDERHPEKTDDDYERFLWRNAQLFHNDSENVMRESENTDVRLATSFVFTKGVGASQLFGHEVNFEEGDVFQFYPRIDWSEHEQYGGDSGMDRISFYLPFISSEKLGQRPSEPQDIGVDIDISFGSLYGHYWEDKYDFDDERSYNTNTMGNISWNYENFILYTEPREWEVPDNMFYSEEEMYGRNAWQIRFNEPATVTFLCSGRNRERPNEIESEDGEIVDYRGNSEYWWHGANAMHLSPDNYMDMDKRETALEIHDYHMNGEEEEDPLELEDYPLDIGNNESFSGTFEPFFYDVYSPSEITDDIWMKENDSSGQGMEAYSHAFHVAEYYSNISYQMVDEEGGTIWVNESDNDGSRTAGEFLSDLWNGFKNGAISLAEGVRDLPGRIRDGLYWIYDSIQEAFTVLYEVLIEFIDIIWGILQDIGSLLGELFYRIGHIAGLLGFAFLMGGTAKILNFTDWNQKFKNLTGAR